MRPSRCKNLGRLTALVLSTYEHEDQDREMDGSGECGGFISNTWSRRRDLTVQLHGFANMHHFLAVVERRTTNKTLHNLGLHP